MKKLILTLSAVAVSALTMYAQGRVNFNNYISGNAVTIDSLNAAPGQGAAGAYVGGNYSVQLLWGTVGSTYADLAAFLASNPTASPISTFFGATGGSPGTDGAGLFDGGTPAFGGPAGNYTAVVRAWYNGGNASLPFNTTGNAGYSALFVVGATAAPTPAPNTTFASFTVASVPEPGTLALAGLGAASLLLFRRKK